MTMIRAISAMRQADGCNDCFNMNLGLIRAICDVPQPRWIGERYFASTPRTVVVQINPAGGGPNANPKTLRQENQVYRDFYLTGDYELVRQFFAGRLAIGQTGQQWLTYYRDYFGLDHDKIAQINIAWCAARDDKRPIQMRKHCFDKHTSNLLDALEPEIVLLSGRDTHRFAPDIQASQPQAIVEKTFHFMNRKSRKEKQIEGNRIKGLMAGWRKR